MYLKVIGIKSDVETEKDSSDVSQKHLTLKATAPLIVGAVASAATGYLLSRVVPKRIAFPVAAAVSSAASSISTEPVLRFFGNVSDEIEQYSMDDVKAHYKNAENLDFHELKYYVQHPLQERNNYLIEINNFVDFIENERLTEIINYVQNVGHFTSIEITTDVKSGFSGGAGLSTEGITSLLKSLLNSKVESNEKDNSKKDRKKDKNGDKINISVEKSKDVSKKIIVKCPKDSFRDPKEIDFVWMNSFNILKAAVDNSGTTGSAKIEVTQKIKNNFEVKAAVLEKIGPGVNLKTEKEYNLTIKAER